LNNHQINFGDADNNTAVGAGALKNNTTGSSNTAVGFIALGAAAVPEETGSFNTAVGGIALASNTSGGDNTAVGYNALVFNTSGGDNSAVGSGALLNNTTGRDNTALGVSALEQSVGGQSNTAVGVRALENLNSELGRFNTAVGVEALRNGDGFNNTALGVGALVSSTGNNNTAVGENAGLNLISGDNNIYLRAFGAATESNTMRLGRGQISTFIAGIAGRPSPGGNPVMINSDGKLGTTLSSARYKQDIQTMGTRSQGLLQLRPVTFRYKQDAQGERQYGLIAEEVAKVYPELVTRGADGEIEAVRYQELTPMLLNEQQRQQRQLSVLKAENERLRAMVAQQQERDTALAARLERLEAAAARAAAYVSR
jgi:hypothetical protein